MLHKQHFRIIQAVFIGMSSTETATPILIIFHFAIRGFPTHKYPYTNTKSLDMHPKTVDTYRSCPKILTRLTSSVTKKNKMNMSPLQGPDVSNF